MGMTRRRRAASLTVSDVSRLGECVVDHLPILFRSVEIIWTNVQVYVRDTGAGNTGMKFPLRGVTVCGPSKLLGAYGAERFRLRTLSQGKRVGAGKRPP
ncbi:hypothetical protein RHCRD62_30229 [Rhodococcus sp. RD6.2]|nr:hypothetical protein RHCRD62_30229 [Rhodococcus sp. RD6.2]